MPAQIYLRYTLVVYPRITDNKAGMGRNSLSPHPLGLPLDTPGADGMDMPLEYVVKFMYMVAG